MNNKWINIIDC